MNILTAPKCGDDKHKYKNNYIFIETHHIVVKPMHSSIQYWYKFRTRWILKQLIRWQFRTDKEWEILQLLWTLLLTWREEEWNLLNNTTESRTSKETIPTKMKKNCQWLRQHCSNLLFVEQILYIWCLLFLSFIH